MDDLPPLPSPHAKPSMRARVESYDWSHTSLGPRDSWPPVLRVAVDLLLTSKFPKCLVWGSQRNTLYNDAFEPILGDKPDALGRPFDDVWAEAWDEIQPMIEKAYGGEPTFIENFPLRIDRSGEMEQAWFTFCYSPVRDEHGVVRGMLDTVIETTQGIRAEARLRDIAERFERQVAERTADLARFWQLSSDLMLVARQDLTISAVNPAWRQALGWQESELIERNVYEVLHPDDHPTLRAAVRLLDQGQRLDDIDCRLRHRDGGYRWINWAAVPGDGFYHAVGRDVTVERERAAALREAEELLRHSQKMEALGQLTGGLAHDFNNLLTGIGGNLEMLQRRLDQGRTADLTRYIEAARSASQRAAILTHRLLAFARRQTLTPKATAVDTLVADLEPLIRQTTGPGIDLHIDIEPTPWRVLVDPSQLESTVLNLCVNARDAMPHGGALYLRIGNHLQQGSPRHSDELPPGEYLELVVQDTGSGMTDEVIDRAFDPFFTTKPLGQGTGLGLSMVYGFARQSGGRILIESSPGIGTRMHLYLPRHLGVLPAPEPALPIEPAALGTGERILLVDDEASLRLLVGDALREQGYQVVEADGASAALARFEQGHFDLLLTDVGLPRGLNGRQLADALRLQAPGLPVLFITGYAAEMLQTPSEGLQVLLKPFDLDSLVRRVRLLLPGP